MHQRLWPPIAPTVVLVESLQRHSATTNGFLRTCIFETFGAYRNPGDLTPWVAGVLGATLVVWVTFVPCFLLVLGVLGICAAIGAAIYLAAR